MRRASLATILVAILAATWAVAVPDSVCIQGVLTDAGGDPLTGTRVYGVQYYDAESGGSSLGATINGSVTVEASGQWSIVITPPAEVVNASGEVWYALGIDSAASPDGSLDPGDIFGGRVRVGSVYFAQRADDADALNGRPASQYATDTELTNGLAAKADVSHSHDSRYYTESEVDTALSGKANTAHNHSASNITSGTLGTNRYSAVADLSAEGKLDNNAGSDLLTRTQADGRYGSGGGADSVTSAMIVDGEVTAADLEDGAALAEIGDDDGAGSGLDADLLDGQHGAYYRSASNLNAGTLPTARYSAYSDLSAESKIGVGSGLVAAGDHVVHGDSNTTSASHTAIGGGEDNTITSGSTGSVIGGGTDNRIEDDHSTIGGGEGNLIEAANSTIGGGGTSTGMPAAIGHQIYDRFSTIAGGYNNTAGVDDGDQFNQDFATVGGGSGNTASGDYATVGGGNGNTASGASTTVGGGFGNTASGICATVGGGGGNTAAGDYSLAAGYSADANYDYSMIFNASTSTTKATSRTGQFKITADGGVYIDSDSSGLSPAALKVAASGSSAVAIHAEQNSSDCALVLANAGSGPLIKAYQAGNQLRFMVSNAGNVTADGSFTGGGADFAEYLPQRNPAEPLEAGDVVGLYADGLSKTTTGAQRILAITTKPLVLGNAPGGDAPANHAAVAMLGQAPVKVRGAVRAGDYLVAAGDNGAAIAMDPAALTVEDYARVVGTALETSEHDGIQAVRASVGLGNDGLWARALEERDARMSALEQDRDARMASLRQELAELRTVVDALLTQAH